MPKFLRGSDVPANKDHWLDLDVQVVRVDGSIHWFPKSQLRESPKAGTRNCTIGISEWLAKERGL